MISSPSLTGLRDAVPYLRLFRGKTFVVKAGGAAFADAATREALLDQVATLHHMGIRIVLVHGGGPQTTALGRRLGVEPRFVEGRRVTSPATLEASTMALNGALRTEIVASFRRHGISAVGLCGADADLVTATRRLPRTVDGIDVDYGEVGDLEAVDTTVLTTLLDDERLPVVSPLSADSEGRLLNLNADGVAARIACTLDAVKLLLVTGAAGLLEDPADSDSLISVTDLAGLERLQAAGSLQDGMLPKAAAMRDALVGGVPRVHVLSHQRPDSLLVEVFTNEGSGTLVVRDVEPLQHEATA